jgi:hypothetical protein
LWRESKSQASIHDPLIGQDTQLAFILLFSGIQFPYFAKIIGDPIPPDRLCRNVLSKVAMYLPDGRMVRSKFPMLSFMRSNIDEWLCHLAQGYGAKFRDGCSFKSMYE